MNASSYPLVKGDNSLTIKVSDATGLPVRDARVDVRYYMPAIPGMAPIRGQKALTRNAYAFGVNILMVGGWKLDATVTQPGKPAVTVTFKVDAR